MFRYFSKSQRAYRKLIRARWNLIVDHAGDFPGKPGSRPSDQLGRYIFAPDYGVNELHPDHNSLVISFNPDWVLKIKMEILMTDLYSMMP